MLNLLFLGQNWVKNLILISAFAHTYNIPDNPLTRYKIYLWHKDLFIFFFDNFLQTPWEERRNSAT